MSRWMAESTGLGCWQNLGGGYSPSLTRSRAIEGQAEAVWPNKLITKFLAREGGGFYLVAIKKLFSVVLVMSPKITILGEFTPSKP